MRVTLFTGRGSGASWSFVRHISSSRPSTRLFRPPNCSFYCLGPSEIQKSIHRHFSNSQLQKSFPDPSRADLFYHFFSPPPVYALSFLSTPPPSVDSCTVIGWLPAVSEREGQEAGLRDFKENKKFRVLLHQAIRDGLKEGVDKIQINGAIQLHQGWMHIHDNRNVPALGRIGDPDDILASVRVEDGKILPETYQEMPSYRFCTVDGLPQLSRGLAHKLRVILQERAHLERMEMA